MDISVVIPLLNEEDSLAELHDWIVKVMEENEFTYEIIFIDDGSHDGSWEVIKELNRRNDHVRGVKFRRNYGKSAALDTGFRAAAGDVVITMDADLQDSPEEIPGLYTMVINEKYDLVSGWKKVRHDPFGKRFPSRFFNWTTRAVSGIKLHDFNCGLKAYRKEVVKNIEVYGEMHRYIPVLAKRNGFARIGEKVVEHHSRKYGSSKYGIERMMKGYLDLLSITFVTRFARRPMHFFGSIGTLMFILGFFSAVWVGGQKLYDLSHGHPSMLVADSPYFYLALTLMILGTQLFLTGFLAEMVARTDRDRNRYVIEDKTGIPEAETRHE